MTKGAREVVGKGGGDGRRGQGETKCRREQNSRRGHEEELKERAVEEGSAECEHFLSEARLWVPSVYYAHWSLLDAGFHA